MKQLKSASCQAEADGRGGGRLDEGDGRWATLRLSLRAARPKAKSLDGRRPKANGGWATLWRTDGGR